MSVTIQKNPAGPLWPLGFIAVPIPGTPVNFMSVVDPTSINAPNSPTTQLSGEYTPRAQELVIQARRPGASHGTVRNTGNVYICVAGSNRDDTGGILATLEPGQSFILSSAALNRNVWSPYSFNVDADTAGDGVFVDLVIQ